MAAQKDFGPVSGPASPAFDPNAVEFDTAAGLPALGKAEGKLPGALRRPLTARIIALALVLAADSAAGPRAAALPGAAAPDGPPLGAAAPLAAAGLPAVADLPGVVVPDAGADRADMGGMKHSPHTPRKQRAGILRPAGNCKTERGVLPVGRHAPFLLKLCGPKFRPAGWGHGGLGPPYWP